jgi:hypothetical protein
MRIDSRAILRTWRPDAGHDAPEHGEFVRGAGGERPVLERGDVRGHPAEGLFFLLLLAVAGIDARHYESGLRFGYGPEVQL